ncbi:MAG: efflux RND transporter periplasmic adaptor subunit [Anaerolineae bacterium]|nr:efflux RND transporter periplasmic adaptor subunit [Anaerolineae bacterium]
MMKRAWIWLILILLIAGGVGFWWLRTRQPQEQALEILRTAEVVREDLEITVSASGNVAVDKTVDLQFDTPGTVTDVYVEVGERVQKGAALARLDVTDLERAVRQAEIALEQARLNLKTVTRPVEETDLELARLGLQSAAQALEVARMGKITTQADANSAILQVQRTRENAYTMYRDAEDRDSPALEHDRDVYEDAEEQEAITRRNMAITVQRAQEQWLTAYQNYQQAEWNLEKLEKGPDEEEIRLAELQVEQAELNFKQARENLDEATLRAPFAGSIVEVNVQQHVLSPVQLPAFVLVDDAVLYVDVMVDEIEIGKIVMDQLVDVTLDAYPALTLKGRVASMAPSPTDVGGVVSYLLRVRLTDISDAEVRDGMTASVLVRTQKIENALLIPNWAVRTEQSSGETYVYCYCLENGVPKQIDITVGKRNDTFTEVLSGLDEGATIALVLEERELDFGPSGQ